VKGDADKVNRNNNWLIAIAVVLVLALLACCVLAAVAATVGWVADDAVYGPMMGDPWNEDHCPGCPGTPGQGPVGMRPWVGTGLLLGLGLLVLLVLAALVVAALLWARRSSSPRVEDTRDVPEVPEIEE